MWGDEDPPPPLHPLCMQTANRNLILVFNSWLKLLSQKQNYK